MAGTPKKREKRERALALMNSPNFMPELCEYLSSGGSLVEFATTSQIPYGRLNRFLTEDEGRKAMFEAAKRARALWHVNRVESLANAVENAEIDPQAAKVSADIRKWVASRMDVSSWGDKLQTKVEFTDTTQLHLEAVRNLMKTVASVEPEKVTRDTATDAEIRARDSKDGA
jgi:hypothetical protein